ncbi:MAG: hypothetical protein CM1200mP35_02940 [Chloroflexota bacterium]|nr:MAG: hypothetical protein CM1200mP35_02940 [Chloroflexota bacterium]
MANPPSSHVSKKRNGDGVSKISVPLGGDVRPGSWIAILHLIFRLLFQTFDTKIYLHSDKVRCLRQTRKFEIAGARSGDRVRVSGKTPHFPGLR